jgi:mannosyl-oligosaccharide glucosidase
MGGSDHAVDSFAMPLFSASPSRSFFPRGFAWDEGFHQQLILKWDLKLGSDILSHWLQTLHGDASSGVGCGGWLPREQALGGEAMKRVPSEFLPQDITVANPPTLLLLLDALVKQSSQSRDAMGSADGIIDRETADWLKQKLIPALFPRAAAWIDWMMKSQLTTRDSNLLVSTNIQQRSLETSSSSSSSSAAAAAEVALTHPSLFRWRGRDANEGKLMTTTFASGLDDYPRALFPSQKLANESYVVCLLCLFPPSLSLALFLIYVHVDYISFKHIYIFHFLLFIYFCLFVSDSKCLKHQLFF